LESWARKPLIPEESGGSSPIINYYDLFRGTLTRIWLDFAFQEVFALAQPLSGETAARSKCTIDDCRFQAHKILALTLLGPIVATILFLHLLMAPSGLPLPS